MKLLDDNTRLDRVAHHPELTRVTWRASTAHKWLMIGYVRAGYRSACLYSWSQGRGLRGHTWRGNFYTAEDAAMALVRVVVADREAMLSRARVAA